MRIGIDISMLVYQGSGVASYTYQMVKNLIIKDNENEYVLFYSSLRKPVDFTAIDKLKKLGATVYEYKIPTRILNILWNTLHVLPIEWLIGKVDIFFSSDFLRPPLNKKTVGITTIHDLTWKLFPQFHTSEIIQGHERKIEKTIKYGDVIITDSKSTQRDLTKLYPEIKKTNKIFTIYPGIDEQFKKVPEPNVESVLKKYNISYPSKYVLYVGAIEPRKQLDIAITIFSKLISIPKYKDYTFYIAGRAGWKNENIYSLVTKLGLKNKVIFLGYIAEEDLPGLYSGAEVNMYLSKYEGFGLPPIEAAACGTPTLLYKNSSLQELFSKDYPYAQEGNELEQLVYILTTKNVIKKEDIKRFSWENFTKEFIKIINTIKIYGK